MGLILISERKCGRDMNLISENAQNIRCPLEGEEKEQKKKNNYNK